MIKVEAQTLQEAYSKAAKELSCSVVELDLRVIQYPSSGFLGMFKKVAIVEARVLGTEKQSNEHKQSRHQKKEATQKESPKEVSTQHEKRAQINPNKKSANSRRRERQRDFKKDTQKKETQVEKKEVVAKTPHEVKKVTNEQKTNTIFDEKFHKEKLDINIAIIEISKNVNTLFKATCFDITEIKVSAYSEDVVLLEFGGVDSALLIGKEGYRYKAISYMLYNWINIKYGLGIRLEIAEFLKNQEEMMGKYLVSIIERVKKQGRAQTKILDGVLIKIALEKLRFEFPDKYVAIKSGREGGRFIVVNDFNRKNL